ACFTEGVSATVAAEMYQGENAGAGLSNRADPADSTDPADKGRAEKIAAGTARRKAEEGRHEATVAGPEIKAESWLTPVEIRDALKRMGFPFENYKAN